MTKPHRRGDLGRWHATRRVVIVLLFAATGGLISGILMSTSGTPPTQAILGGSATATLLFLDKIIR
jgi:hypothetical protein